MKINKQIVDKAFAHTSHWGRVDGDKIKIDTLRREFILTMSNDGIRYDYYNENLLNPWEKDLLETGNISDKVILINENRPGFIRDRDCYIDNIYYPDRWFSTFMLIINSLFEEKVTLSLFRKDNVAFDFYLIENEKAPKIDELARINAEPDFIMFNKDNQKCYVEQKSIYNNKKNVYIRTSQYNLFGRLEDVYILTKIHNYNSVTYKFYNYNDIKQYLIKDNRGYYFNMNDILPEFQYIDIFQL